MEVKEEIFKTFAGSFITKAAWEDKTRKLRKIKNFHTLYTSNFKGKVLVKSFL